MLFTPFTANVVTAIHSEMESEATWQQLSPQDATICNNTLALLGQDLLCDDKSSTLKMTIAVTLLIVFRVFLVSYLFVVLNISESPLFFFEYFF